MIDFYIQEYLNNEKIKNLLNNTTDLQEDDVFICNIEWLNTHSVPTDCKCLCVISELKGDVSLLVQIYRYQFNLLDFIKKLRCFCKDKSIACYIPFNDFDDYYFLNHTGDIYIVRIDISSTDEVIRFNSNKTLIENFRKKIN